MATVCSSSLALMDAGVPIESAVAGVALGLIEQDGKHCILTDIAGLEDHYGDMDFKVAGTTKGITAIQVDVKNQGLSLELVKDILSQAREGRLYILDKMNQVLAASRSQLSDYAPRIKTMPIDRSKIGELIGPGGKMIRHLTTKYDATIDIDDEQALVSVATNSQENLDALVNEIEQLTKDVEVGEIYQATVDKITNFGAFCKITPNKSGLLHISEISNQFTKDVRDRIKEGDQFPVKVISIDDQGRINLSKKQAE
jgi:polyribonucleotide nucleotidyltransferase